MQIKEVWLMENWALTAGRCAAEIVKVVHQLNDAELPTGQRERHQRRLITISLMLWELQHAMATAAAVDGSQTASIRPLSGPN